MSKSKKANMEDDSIEDVLEETAVEPTMNKVGEVDLSITQIKGIGEKTSEKLNNFGVISLYDICVRGAKEISEITGVDKSTASNWVFKSQKILEDNNLVRPTDMTTKDLLTYHSNLPRLKTHCTEIDNLFGGGLVPESVYEIYGEFGSGKTQFCLSLTAECLAKDEKIIWIDCEDTFRPNRLVEIMVARGLVPEASVAIDKLDNIKYFHCPTTEQMLGVVNSLSKMLLEFRPRLVVLDGAIGQFREEYLGRGTLSERQNEIARLMTHIKNISYYFRCTVLFTNQVQSDPSVMFGDPIKPIGGNVVAHASTYRIYFKKSGKNRLAKMIDSPEHKNREASYILNEKGIDNVEL
jgi:DNA repair protein RadA